MIQQIKRLLGLEIRDKKAEIYEHPERKKEKAEQEPERKELLETIEKNEERFGDMPYVWGGNSPSSVVSFIKSTLMRKKQPKGSWRQGQPLKPGFDCSGWIQYNLRKAGFDMPSLKKIGCKTLDMLKTEEGEVGDIAKKAEPGDIIVFKKKGGEPEHTAFYLGDGKISEAAGTKKVDQDNPYLKSWETYAHPDEKGKTKEDMGGVQESDISRYQGRFMAELVPLSKIKKR